MFQGCKATGRMSHNFDKTTHRCKCGRWQAGFKPKTEPVKPRAECQICERKQATDKDGTLGHHGYKRPGWGFIQGDCMGESYKPYPATDALERYLVMLKNYIISNQESLANLPNVKGLPYTFTVGSFKNSQKVDVTVLRGAEPYYQWNGAGGINIPAFEYLETIARHQLESNIDFAKKDQARVEQRIANAKEQTESTHAAQA